MQYQRYHDSDDDSDTDIDGDARSFMEIYMEQEAEPWTPKVNGAHYIGLCSLVFTNEEIPEYFLMESTVSTKVFYHYPGQDILQYLAWMASVEIEEPQIEVLQLYIDDAGVYKVVIKTWWIRWIQRRWRKICRDRHEILRKRSHISSLRYHEIHGQWPAHLNKWPGITGMLQ
jgi:hypothetical protein